MLFPFAPSRTVFTALLFLSFIEATTAFHAFSNSSFSSAHLSAPCTRALTENIDCSPVVAGLRVGSYYPESTLKRTCTTECAQALSQYTNKIAAACNNQTWNGYEDTDMPVAIIPDMLRYHYNLTCLMDSGRYCNIVGAQAAGVLDPEGINMA